LAVWLATIACLPLGARDLHVCADPNNLPYSNRWGQGFENRLAQLIARDLHANLDYVWWSQRKNFLRETLNAGRCDLVMGVPANMPNTLTSRPYYRSSYVFVFREHSGLDLISLDDPALQRLRIGVHVVGDAYAPPAQALARRGIVRNIVGFSLLGQNGEPNPARGILDALARGQIDVALVWGPQAGYFAARERVRMRVTPLPAAEQTPTLPFAYEISVAIRPGDQTMRSEIDGILERRRDEIRHILTQFRVPQLENAEDKYAWPAL
jgi:mxaJ protein